MRVEDVLLRRKNKVLIEGDNCEIDNSIYVASINANIMSLGFTFSVDLFNALKNKSIEQLSKFSIKLVEGLEKLVGADVRYKPMYPGFPKQVMKMSEFELYYNAMVHYLERDLHYLGIETVEEEVKDKQLKMYFSDDKKYTTLEVGSNLDIEELFSNLLNMKTAYSEQDREDLQCLMKSINYLPFVTECEFAIRENFAFIFATVLSEYAYSNDGAISTRINRAIKKAYKLKNKIISATDILRICCVLNGGDVSLSRDTPFKSLPRKLRRFILSLFNDIKDSDEDISYRNEQFKMLFRYLHVDEYVTKEGKPIYQNISNVINNVRDGKLTRSFYGKVDTLLKVKDEKVLQLLCEKPGVFARKLDSILRVFAKKEQVVLLSFESVAVNVATKILFSMMEHFRKRTQNELRCFFPKGDTSKAITIPNRLPLFSEEVVDRVIDICKTAILKQLALKPNMGKVFISNRLRDYKAPFVLRNITSGSKVITRGTRIKCNDKNVLRLFIWWKDDVDNDLSVVFFDKNFNYISRISYTELKNNFGCHSGDITYQRKNGVEGECEFIDIDIEELKKAEVAYAACEVHNFRGLNFSDSNCRFGFMKIDEKLKFIEGDRTCTNEIFVYPKTDEIFNPLEVENLINITAQATSILPFIYEVKTNEIIWCDTSIKTDYQFKAVETSLPSAMSTCYACVNGEMPNLYEVLYLNALARGEIVENKEDADLIFDIDDGITPFDIEIIAANYLG